MIKQLVILAGGNGSGKSTFYNEYLKDQGIDFINADEIAKRHFPGGTAEDSRRAQEYARTECDQYLAAGQPFCFETVFSHVSKKELIKKAKRLGYQVDLIYIHLEDSQLNQARVLQRVVAGGHPVPNDKIVSRLPRTFANIKEALKLVDTAKLLDNSLGTDPFRIIATVEQQIIKFKANPFPAWANDILKDEAGS